jgi:hypothetical protein
MQLISLAPLPPHSSDQTPPLDLDVFDIVKSFSLDFITGTCLRESTQAMLMFDAWQRVPFRAFSSLHFVPLGWSRSNMMEKEMSKSTF